MLDQGEHINTAVPHYTLPHWMAEAHFDTVDHTVCLKVSNVHNTRVLCVHCRHLRTVLSGEVSGVSRCPPQAPPVEIPQAYSE